MAKKTSKSSRAASDQQSPTPDDQITQSSTSAADPTTGDEVAPSTQPTTPESATDTEIPQDMGKPDLDMVKAKFADYVEKLQDGEIKEVRNAWDITGKTQEHAIEALERLKSLYEIVSKTQHEYNQFNRNVALQLVQEKDDLTAYIGSYQTLYTELTTGLQETCLTIKEINKKMIAVKNEANQLEQAVKDTCNQQDANDLDTKLKLDLKLGTKTANFSEAVKNLHNQADYSLQDTVEIFNAAVKVAGITALLNLDGLSASFAEVGTNVDSLAADVTENIKTNAESAAKQATDYETAIKDLQKAKDEKKQKSTHFGAFSDIIKFIENKDGKQRKKGKADRIDNIQDNVREQLELWKKEEKPPE